MVKHTSSLRALSSGLISSLLAVFLCVFCEREHFLFFPLKFSPLYTIMYPL